MKLPVVHGRHSERDIEAQVDYYLEQDALDAAGRFLDALDHFCDLVSDNPDMGTPYELDIERLRHAEIRRWALGHGFPHSIYYTWGEREVRILRVLHGARDVPSAWEE